MQALDCLRISRACGWGYMSRSRKFGRGGNAVSSGPRNIDSLFASEPRSLSASGQQSQPKYSGSFNIYKSSSAMRMKPLKPTWKAGGEMGDFMSIERTGIVLVEFTKSSGVRQYNWEEKQMFGLSPLEIAAIIENPSGKHECYHDPGMKSSNQGQVVKVLRVTPTDNGHFFSLRVKNQGKEFEVSVPVSRSEFKLFHILSEYWIPRLMGFDKVLD